MAYLHGAYGEITTSKVTPAKQTDSVAAYIGTAPINLVRGYAEKNLINMPIRLANIGDTQAKVGYCDDWASFTLCEVFASHFDNTVGNVGPIYIVNVLDPDAHRKAEKTTAELTFTNSRAEFESTDIILDTFAIADKAEGVDYTLEYNYAKGAVIVKLLAGNDATLSCTYNTVDVSKVEEGDIIGQTTADNQYHGLHALKLLYQYHNAVLNMLAAPGWSHKPAVYKAMVSIVQKLNGHWDGFVNADIPLESATGDAIDTLEEAIAWKNANGYTSEFSKVYWPQVKDGSGRAYHLSTVGQTTMLRVDLSHDSIPFETPSNKQIMAVSQYFGETSKSKGFDQQTGNTLNEKGITTAVYWGSRWVLWGPHTAAFTYNGDHDARSIFDVNLRMLMHITNKFQLDYGTEIDKPMTPQEKDTILNAEREKLDTLCGIGALIGTPTVEFIESENPVSDMMNGDFVWNFNVTNTPPFKSGTARVTYTDEGFAAFFGE
ncbi:MAG: phage tail sheath family protein [Clostridia bacterium]|nr:phage tail sheath family protein [Clostridia bacterium]